MNVTSYNAMDCTVTVDNTYITQLGEDMVSGSKDEEFFSTSVGAQGDVVRSEVNNSLGTVALTIQVTSPQKAFLMKLAETRAIVPIWVTNKSLGERFGGSKASIKNFPEFARGAEAEDMEFEFQVFDYTVEAI